MLSEPTSDYLCCRCCNVRFQRLSSHLSRNEFCGTYYKNMPLDIGNGGVTDDMHVPGVAYFIKAGCQCQLLIMLVVNIAMHHSRDCPPVIYLGMSFVAMTMMPLLCLTGTTLFLATRNLTTIARMRRFPMVSLWICSRKCKSCDQIKTWSGQVCLRREGACRVCRVIASTEGVQGPTESFFWHSELFVKKANDQGHIFHPKCLPYQCKVIALHCTVHPLVEVDSIHSY